MAALIFSAFCCSNDFTGLGGGVGLTILFGVVGGLGGGVGLTNLFGVGGGLASGVGLTNLLGVVEGEVYVYFSLLSSLNVSDEHPEQKVTMIIMTSIASPETSKYLFFVNIESPHGFAMQLTSLL